MTLWKPTHTYRCKRKGCYVAVGFMSAEACDAFARDHLAKRCPNPNSVTTSRGSVARMILEEIWQEADAALDRFFLDQSSEYEKGVLGGLCSALFKLSVPYYDDVTQVKRHLMERRERRQSGAGLADFVTPGATNVRIHPEESVAQYPASGGWTTDPAMADFPPPGYPQARVDAARAVMAGARRSFGPDRDPALSADLRASTGPRVPASAAAPSSPPGGQRVSGRIFSDEEVGKIKALVAGGFDLSLIATRYKCSEADVQSVLD